MTLRANRRFEDHKKAGHPLVLSSTHKAVVGAMTLFPSRVAKPHLEERLFKSGQNSRKIGSHVTKGMWKGMPIYTLTLEERATCPSVCEHWNDCFGNKMHWSTRWQAGPLLEKNIPVHIAALAEKHPKGFVVRLHVLGDFYGLSYMNMWVHLMELFPQLRVFGYTRRRSIPDKDVGLPSALIGYKIEWLNKQYPDRWRIRWSEMGGEMGTVTISDVTQRGKIAEGIVCPAQTGDASCCGTCALCWQSSKPIVFLNH